MRAAACRLIKGWNFNAGLLSVMESDQQTAPQIWTSCKLIIDPLLTNGFHKVYRFDGQHFNIPVRDLGVFPVNAVRDPRICRLWSGSKINDFTVPKFKVDECYVGPIPPKEVTFVRLNDNVKEGFLTDMCNKYGHVDEVEIFYNPKSKKHLGIGKVVFDTVKAAKDAAQHLHQTSVMGNIIHVEIDPKGANRQRYLQLLFDGLCDPWTLPVGSDEETLQRFIDKLSGCKPTERETSISSPSSICTSLSLDTAYSSIWQDTPYSFGLTPQSQGTPRTPCLSGTPLSQDSCYSSLQATPVHQGEQSILSVHTLSRREVYSRKRARHFGRRHNSSDISFIVKHLQPQHFLPDQMTGAGPSLRPALCSQNTISSDGHHTETSLPECSEVPTTSLNVNISSPIILSINVAAEKGPVYQSRVTELPASPVDAAREGLHPELESLDSRIEMLLNKSKSADGSCFDDGSLEAAGAAENFPASDLNSLYGTPGLDGSPPISKKPSSPDGLVDVSPTPLPDTEEEETVQAVASLLRVTTSPLFKHMERRVNGNQASMGTDKKRPYSFSCPKEHHAPNEETETLKRKSAAFISIGPSSMPQHPPLPLFRGSCQLPPPRPLTSDLSGHSPLPVHPFTFPIPSIPPPIPPFSVHLPINFPPPGWIPPPVLCSSITVPPPSIPPPLPPTSLLGPPHPLIAPPVVHPYPSHRQPAEPLDKENLLRQASASFVYRPPWPSLPLAQFNPFVPPPGYVPVRENPHKATMDKVLEVIVEELKSIIKKDITRRMIEGTAFNAFDEWWGCQEHKAKVAESPSKARLGRMDEKAKPINPLRPIIGRHESIPLPSFKVKRKGASGACRSEGLENTASAHQKEYQIENPELEKGSDRAEQPSEDLSGAGCPTLKRRHARPIQLESDDDEASEDGDTQQEADITPDKEEASTAVNNATQVQFDIEDHDVQGADEAVQRPERTGVQVITSKSADAMHYSDSEFLSDATSSSSEESECSSHFDSCESSSSAGTEVSSDDDSSSEEDEFTEEDRSEECIVISSDEESMELEAPATPLAPLTPGAQLELTMQEWLVGGLRTRLEEDQCLGCVQDPGALDPVMAIQTNGNQDLLRPPSPIGIQVREPFDLEMESPEWVGGSLLRPLTPTGSLEDSDPDLLLADKPLPPAAKSVERPRTPGRGGAALSDGENSESELFSLPPASPASDLFPAAIHAPYPTYQDMPKTPGTEERSGWTPFGSARCPATPGRDTSPSAGSRVMSPPLSSPLPLPLPLPSLSNNPYIKTPKTPGRDMHLHCRAAVCRKRRNTVPPLSRDDFLGGSPIMVSCPCSLSDSSAETPVPKGARIGAGAASKPLQGLENMPGLLHEENRRGPERALLRTEQRRWRRQRMRRRRRWMRQRRRQTMAAPSPGSPPWSRSQCEETNILHDVWSEGLDEEDEQLLQAMYERLLREDSGCGWLSDTRWIPHPLTRIRPEKNEEHDAWPGSHVTGSARSEGFYKISRRDKMKYLNDTQLTLEPPSASTQRSCTSASQQTSLRAGSDFRSEQRRLLSFFSCDSDLVKFNQLQYRKKMIRFCRSHIHDWGLFAMEPIAVDEMVIEYVGQTIRQVIADMREKRYEDEGIGSSYLFRIDQDIIIDATKCGNLARFINHSCNPNCYAKIITVESQKKIVIYSRQQISIHEEITYDYKFPIEDEKIPCLCGAEGCRGTLN